MTELVPSFDIENHGYYAIRAVNGFGVLLESFRDLLMRREGRSSFNGE